MMCLRRLFHFPICLLAFTSCAQQDSTAPEPRLQRFFYKLGNTNVSIRKTTYDTASAWFFIQLHDDETTAQTAAASFLQQHGGTLLSIENRGERYIRFLLNGRRYLFDPNRMFTANGLRQNLQLFESYSEPAAKAIAGFRRFLLDLIPDTALVIAIHNNTEGRYSIHSYKRDKTRKRNAHSVHINPVQDADDFFITTDDGLFKKLAAADYNCVLQNNKILNDDGSLSSYFGRRRKSYVNVEAQSGHLLEQQRMMQVLKTAILE